MMQLGCDGGKSLALEPRSPLITFHSLCGIGNLPRKIGSRLRGSTNSASSQETRRSEQKPSYKLWVLHQKPDLPKFTNTPNAGYSSQ